MLKTFYLKARFKFKPLKSGTLSFSEFLTLMVKQEGLDGVKHAFQVWSPNKIFCKIYSNIFQSYDTDGSGKITAAELSDWMKKHGRVMNPDGIKLRVRNFEKSGPFCLWIYKLFYLSSKLGTQIKLMIDAFDENDDGEIERD